MGNLIGLRFDTSFSEGLLLRLQPSASGPDFRLLQTPLNAMEHAPSPPVLCFSPQRTGQLVTCHLSRPLIFGFLCHPQSCQLFPKPVIPRGVQALSHQGTVCLAKRGQWLRPPPAPGPQQWSSKGSKCWQHETRNTLEGKTCDQKPFRAVAGAESSGAPVGRQECSLLGRQ